MPRLTFEDRKRVKKMYDNDTRTIEIAARLGCSMTTIYDELKRGYSGRDEQGRPIYDPLLAQRNANRRIKRCGPRKEKAAAKSA